MGLAGFGQAGRQASSEQARADEEQAGSKQGQGAGSEGGPGLFWNTHTLLAAATAACCTETAKGLAVMWPTGPPAPLPSAAALAASAAHAAQSRQQERHVGMCPRSAICDALTASRSLEVPKAAERMRAQPTSTTTVHLATPWPLGGLRCFKWCGKCGGRSMLPAPPWHWLECPSGLPVRCQCLATSCEVCAPMHAC
jgi:hypothetical protein